MSDHINEMQVSKPGGKLAWILGIILFIFSLVMFTQSVFAGVLMVLAGLLLLPPSRSWLEKQTKKTFSKKIIGGSVAGLAFVAFITFGVSADTTTTTQSTNTNQVAAETVNTNTENTAPTPAPEEEKKTEETPAAVQPTPQPTPEPTPAPAPATPSKLDQLWSALDNSIKKRDGYDVKWNEGEGIATITHTETSFWDETSLVKGGYNDLVKYGLEAFKIDGVNQVELEIYTELTDSMGNTSNERVMGIQMKKDVFQKFNWENLNYTSVYSQMQLNAEYQFIHPAIMKNVNRDKLYLSI